MFKSISKYTAVFTVGLFAAVGVSLFVTPTSKAHAEEEKKVTQTTAQETPKTSSYSYVAQAGDSYSKLARKAVQTYGLKNKVNLTQAQIIAAETSLTVAAGSPELNLGEKRAFSESDVKAAVEAAQKLPANQLAGWQTYVKYVNFNTNNVGQ